MDGITIYTSAFEICSQYDPDTQCRLIGYMVRYALMAIEPEFDDDDAARYIWPAIKDKADRTVDAYEKKSAAGHEGGTATAQSKQKRSTRTAKAKQKRSKATADEQQTDSTASADAQQSASTATAEGKPETETDTDTETDTETDKENETRTHAHAHEEEVTRRFERFWEAYPRKTARKDAEKAFRKINPNDQLMEVMLTALERWKKSDQWTRDGAAYVPHPATWLNGERWQDEVPPPARQREKTVVAQQYQQRDYSQEPQDDVPDWMRERWEEMRRTGS